MHRFYLPEASSGVSIALTEREAHHAANVLRIGKGETVTVLDGKGTELVCEVQEVSKRNVTLITREKKVTPRLPYELTLIQAIPKGKLMESIIQKATELGVSRIVPLLTERVITQVGDEKAELKREKWQQVAIEAVKQCGQTWLPVIDTPTTLENFLERRELFDLPLIASLQSGSRHPRDFFADFQQKNGHPPKSACIWVGPEGDFTRTEVDQIVSSGVLPITLGPLVLRCETAAVYCLSVLSYELQAL